MNIMSPQHLAILALSLAASTALAAPAKPATRLLPAEYEARIQQATADPETLAAGKRAASYLCIWCHGEDGNSVLESIPNLAGQNPVYLLTQIQKFGDGHRNSEFMSGLIKAIKDEDRVSMSVYYAAMRPNTPAATNAALIEKGRKRYLATCVGCHGGKAYGNKRIARLAGQRVSYLTHALANYRASNGTRRDPMMTPVARRLTPEDIAAVSAYLSTLK